MTTLVSSQQEKKKRVLTKLTLPLLSSTLCYPHCYVQQNSEARFHSLLRFCVDLCATKQGELVSTKTT